MKATKKQLNTVRRKNRVRTRIAASRTNKHRVSLAMSTTGMFAQFIDDAKGVTVVSGRDKGLVGTKTDRAALLGESLGKKAVEAGIKTAVLDRGSKQYHGRVKAFADALRKAGVTL